MLKSFLFVFDGGAETIINANLPLDLAASHFDSICKKVTVKTSLLILNINIIEI